MSLNNFFVTPGHGNGNHKWHVKRPHADKSSKDFHDKADALNYAKQHAQKNHSSFMDQKQNGKFNFGNNYKHPHY